jgi:hypothetical protein
MRAGHTKPSTTNERAGGAIRAESQQGPSWSVLFAIYTAVPSRA